jgi:molecular chaperone GrpE (heat shock protein)
MNVNDRRIPPPKKWPFYVADVFLLGFALWLLRHYPHPLPPWAAILMSVCVITAAFFALIPHRMEYQTSVKLAEASDLVDTVRSIQKLEGLAEHVQSATGQWQGVQEHANRAVNSAREIADRITAEARSFAEFMQKANDTEKSALRLEVEKLRRGESQWLQVLVHLLDHVYALHQAAVRSGQPNLQAQLGQFQDACRDIVRRVGLTPFEAEANEQFDPEKHQIPDGQPAAAAEARVAQTLATGYTFQGQLLRRSLVAVHNNDSELDSSSYDSSSFTEPQPVQLTDTVDVSGAADSQLDTTSQSETEIEMLAATDEPATSYDDSTVTAELDSNGNGLPDDTADEAAGEPGLGPEFVVVGEGSSLGPSAPSKSHPAPFRLESEVLPSDEETRRS